MIPEFIPAADRYDHSYLPEGIHDAEWEEIVARFSFSFKRQQLIQGLHAACLNLHLAGVAHLYLDGSFVSNKKNPGDWDACFFAQGVNPLLLDPVLLDYKNERAAQKAKYKGETFLADGKSGTLGPPYLQFFQKNKRTGAPKGIVRIDLRTVK